MSYGYYLEDTGLLERVKNLAVKFFTREVKNTGAGLRL